MVLSSKYPHPDDQSWLKHTDHLRTQKVKRLAAILDEMRGRGMLAEVYEMRGFILEHATDLDVCITEGCRVLEALDARDDREQEQAARRGAL